MPQPTASAPPDASPPAAPQAYRWEVAGKPLAIEVRLDVVERLDQEVLRTFRAITSRGSEIGGLLLGRLRQGTRPVVVIEDYEVVPCDYRRGPLYLLAEEDLHRFEEALARRKQASAQDLRVVGYFRSNTRKELQLDDEDVAILKRYFPDSFQVCLLVKPFASKANLAGFFLWDAGEPQRKSDLTFAFNRAELSKTLAAQPAATSPDSVLPGPTPAVPTGADADGRAPVAPDAAVPEPPAPSRPTIEVRIALAEPGSAPVKRAAPPTSAAERPGPAGPEPGTAKVSERGTASVADESVAPSLPVPADGRPPVDGKANAEGIRAQAAEPISRPPHLLVPAEPLPAAPIERENVGGEAAAAFSAYAAETRSRAEAAARPQRSRVVLGLVGVLALGIAGVAVWNFSRDGAPPSVPETSPLNLRVERSGGQLLLSWNRSLPLLQTAQRAILSISDGDHREDVEIDLGQLRSGSIVYSPITSDVSFRLEVTDLKNGKSVSESVRVLGGRPSPTGPLAESAPAATESQGSNDSARGQRQPAKPMAPIPSPGQRESLAARLSPVEPISAASPAIAELPTRTLPVAGALLPPPPAETSAGAAPASPSTAQPQARPIEPAASQVAATQPVAPQATSAPAAAAPTPQPAKPSTQPEAAAARALPGDQQPEGAQRVGGQVQEARLLRRREPVYPPLARQARIQGVVRLQAVIGPDGRVEKVEAVSGPPLLRQAAVDAVKEWVYEPSRLNGRPVPVTTMIEINFTLGR